MRFSWNEEQEALRAKARSFAEETLNHDLETRDQDLVFDLTAWKACATFGILGCNVPKEYGGQGRDIMTAVALLEAIGQGCRDNGLTLALNSQIWTIHEPLLAFGTEEQKQHYLPRLCSGEILAADAITEEKAGSDAMQMETTAVKQGDTYILNGHKKFIGMAPLADLALVFAKTDPEAGQWGISAFLVETNNPGVTRSQNQKKMGLRTVPTGEFTFNDCVVPASARLGKEGAGMSLFNHTMEWERGLILTSHVGSMQRQLDECIAFAKQREQFGQPIGGFQSVSNRIADMAVRLEACRLALYKVAWLKQEGRPATLEATMANLAISEAFTASSLDAIRTHGARGYLSEYGVERDLRDAVGGVIYAGTSDIQRNLIARLLGI